MSGWDPRQKPDPRQCPGSFCFHWLPRGTSFASGMHEHLEAALAKARSVETERCACPSGSCTRLDPFKGDDDRYEPHERNLARQGLPWFHFVPGPDLLVPELREEYIRNSERLWGSRHWQV